MLCAARKIIVSSKYYDQERILDAIIFLKSLTIAICARIMLKMMMAEAAELILH